MQLVDGTCKGHVVRELPRSQLLRLSRLHVREGLDKRPNLSRLSQRKLMRRSDSPDASVARRLASLRLRPRSQRLPRKRLHLQRIRLRSVSAVADPDAEQTLLSVPLRRLQPSPSQRGSKLRTTSLLHQSMTLPLLARIAVDVRVVDQELQEQPMTRIDLSLSR